MCTYACREGLDEVLMQDNHVVLYESWKLKEHEKNYDIHDLVLTTIVHALKMWRQYLMGKRFELITNHNSLKYLFEQPNLNARKNWLLEFLCEFYFKIKPHKKERKQGCWCTQQENACNAHDNH